MNEALVDQVVSAVLYEGYILYPYRASAKKNRQRFTFGRVYPEAYHHAQNGAESCAVHTECLVRGADAALQIRARFLQPMWREVLSGGVVVPEIEASGRLLQTWQEAVERDVRLPDLAVRDLLDHPLAHSFAFEAAETRETPVEDSAVEIRRRHERIAGLIEVTAQPIDLEVARITIRTTNRTPVPSNVIADQDAILMRTFASTHTILHTPDGEWISLLEPPPEYASAAAACRNTGAWPVLLGDEAKREHDTMLASPIILYDYPKIAPESAGDLFDGGEIDEILTLRIMTMTDAEKAEMRHVDGYARRILERTESLPSEQLGRMHGVLRAVPATDAAAEFFNPRQKTAGVNVDGVYLRKGDRVRIRPKKRADAMDMILAGKVAVIESVEQDIEGAVHFALVIDDDPGQDIGYARMPGHRFFYGSDEVEPLSAGEK